MTKKFVKIKEEVKEEGRFVRDPWKTNKVVIRLPKTLTVNIPAFDDMNLEDVLNIVATDGKDFIHKKVKELVMEEFIKKQGPIIKKAAKQVVDKKQKDLIRIFNESISRLLNGEDYDD
jgi:hypothetical protein